jgi:hypothetical protein
MQTGAKVLTKESRDHQTTQYPLNSYAFYPKNLITTLQRYLPQSIELKTIEELFVDRLPEKDGYNVQNDLWSNTEATDRIRKRVLLSSDYTSSYQVGHIIDCYNSLSSLEKTYLYLWHPGPHGVKAWRKYIESTFLPQVHSKYTQRPKVDPAPCNKRPKLPEDYAELSRYSAFSKLTNDEKNEFLRQLNAVIRYDSWRYSLNCNKNVRFFTDQ